MFRWMRVLPFWDRVGPATWVAAAIAVAGLICLVYGVAANSPSAVIAGFMAMSPGLFLWFLLWRTYTDDGYQASDRLHRESAKFEDEHWV